MKTRFYHFTSKAHLESIRASGYIHANGDCPLTPGTYRMKVLWLTSDGDPKNQHWKTGSVFNKAEVRLSIDLDSKTPGLAYFPEVIAIFNLNADWMDALDPYGYRKNWWIYTEEIKFKESMI